MTISRLIALAIAAHIPFALGEPVIDAKASRSGGKTCIVTVDANSNTGHSVQCVTSSELLDPFDIAIRQCLDEARVHRGTPKWAEHLKPCIERVKREHLGGHSG